MEHEIDRTSRINAEWSSEEQAWVREHAGMYMWEEPREGPANPDYSLPELSALGRRLGLRVARTFLDGYGLGRKVADNQTFIDTLKTETYRDFITSFPTVFFTVAIPPQTWDPAWTIPHYQELTEYLLSSFPDRTFVLGNWEGDYWCPGNRTWDKAIAMFAARQEGIERGRAAVSNSTSKVYHMIEMVKLDYTGKDLMINNLAPRVPADLYSLSCYGYINKLPRALAYMRSKCPPSPAFGHDNLVLGEWGVSYSIKWPPEQRTRFFIERVREMIASRLAYCLYWELEDKDDGLMDGKYHRGRKFSLYYPFYRAYHLADELLVVDDFEADPLSTPGGDYDEAGYSLNTLGGRRGVTGDASAAIVYQAAEEGNPASRALMLTIPAGAAPGSGWQEDLGRTLDAANHQALRLSICGDISGMVVRIKDESNNTATVPLPPNTIAHTTQSCVIDRTAFTGVDWSRLSCIQVVSAETVECCNIVIKDVALLKNIDTLAQCSVPSSSSPRLSHFMLQSSDCAISASNKQGMVKHVEVSTSLETASIIKPTITDGTRTLQVTHELPALHSVSLRTDGTGEVRFEPLSCWMYPTHFSNLGITCHNLARHDDVTRGIWGDIFPAFQLVSAEKTGYLEWRFTSPWSVADFRLTLYLHSRDESPPKGGVGIAVSSDGKQWVECAVWPPESTIWHEDTLIATPPLDMQLGETIYVRYWINAVQSDPEWQTRAGIRNIKAHLTLDTRSATFPQLDGLRYQDSGPGGTGFRGLLNLDW